MNLLKIVIGLTPVLLFLVFLIRFDSFRLVSFRLIGQTLLLGGMASLLSLFLNRWLIGVPGLDFQSYVRYIAPLIEESAKAAIIIYYLRSVKIGFILDAAIFGFTAGAGFALVENVYQFQSADLNIYLWILRGLGTAVMHGGSTAIFAILSKSMIDRKLHTDFYLFLPGVVCACVIHSFFNHLLLLPEILMLAQLLGLPFLFWIIFFKSEKAIHHWIDIGLATEVGLLGFLVSGNVSQSKIGRYLDSLVRVFPAEIITDLFCYLRVYLELSIRVKGILLMHQSGFTVPPDPTIKEKLTELKYLESSIGKTGKRALATLFQTDPKKLWHLFLLKNHR